jgi:hypothetical protein
MGQSATFLLKWTMSALTQKATSVWPPAQGLKSCIRCGHPLHERSSSNDDVACSLTVVSDVIEHRLSTQQM